MLPFSTRATRVSAPAALITRMLLPAMWDLARPGATAPPVKWAGAVQARGVRGPRRATIARIPGVPGFADRLVSVRSSFAFPSRLAAASGAARIGHVERSGVGVARSPRLAHLDAAGPGPREADAFLQDLHSPRRS